MLRTRCFPRPSSSARAVRARHATHRRLYHATTSLRAGASRLSSITSLYIDTNAPTPLETQAATRFFESHLPSKSWTATEWRRQQPQDASGSGLLTPEVAFLGRSNSGKSSLLNAILLDNGLCRVGPKPGKTTTMHAWSLSPTDPATKGAKKGYRGDTEPKLTVLDMPGYGHGSRDEWGEEIIKYLTTRRQLRRAFLLVNPAHGLKKGDMQILRLLQGQQIPHQLIACKCDHDSIKNLSVALGSMQEQVKRTLERGKQPKLTIVNDLLAVGGIGDGKGNLKIRAEQMRGVEDVRWAVLRAAGLDEYAMGILRSGGLPPKLKVAQPTLNTPVVEVSKQPEVTVAEEESVNLFSDPVTEEVSGDPGSKTSQPSIGVGIEELMSMMGPEESQTKSSASRRPSRQDGQGRTRRQRIALTRPAARRKAM